MEKIKTTQDLWETLSNVIEKIESGEMGGEQSNSIINASKVMVSIKNYELNNEINKVKFKQLEKENGNPQHKQ